LKTAQEKYQWECQAYGCTAAAIDLALQESHDPLMLAAGMLSDAQEVISGEYGQPDTETARQYMNRAKYILFQQLEKTRVKARENAC